jgi:muramoyltetrapeptide carboxypeptidase
LKKLLAGQSLTVPVRKRQVLAEGRAHGRLIGGNLTVLAHLQGTRYAPDLGGAVLFLEEVGEQVYRIDRALTQLRMAGALRGVAGVLLGRFSSPPRESFPPDRDPRVVLAEFFASCEIPVIDGLPVGHVAGQWSLPLGGTVDLDTSARRLHLAP